MKKEYLLFLLLGAGAVYFMLRKPKKKRRGSVTVESPKKITEDEFKSREPSDVRELSALGNVLMNRSKKKIIYRRKPEHPNLF
jgi:hypothetical protein